MGVSGEAAGEKGCLKMMGSRSNRTESVGKRAVLLTVLCLAFSGCAFRGKDASGQGDVDASGAMSALAAEPGSS